MERRCLKRRVGTILAALLILLVFSGQAFPTHQSFGEDHDWTGGPYYGTRRTFFADVTGDGRADAIVVNYDKVSVRESNGTPPLNSTRPWTTEPYYGPQGPPYYGALGTFFADVTGDGAADAIVVDYNTVTVRQSMFFEFHLQAEKRCYGG